MTDYILEEVIEDLNENLAHLRFKVLPQAVPMEQAMELSDIMVRLYSTINELTVYHDFYKEE